MTPSRKMSVRLTRKAEMLPRREWKDAIADINPRGRGSGDHERQRDCQRQRYVQLIVDPLGWPKWLGGVA